MSDRPTDDIDALVANAATMEEGLAARAASDAGVTGTPGAGNALQLSGQEIVQAARESKLVLPFEEKALGGTIPVVFILDIPASARHATFDRIVDTLAHPNNLRRILMGMAIQANRQAQKPLDPRLVQEVRTATDLTAMKKRKH